MVLIFDSVRDINLHGKSVFVTGLLEIIGSNQIMLLFFPSKFIFKNSIISKPGIKFIKTKAFSDYSPC